MRQYAIVGLGSFGLRMLEKLSEASAEIIIVDKDAEIIERYKDLASAAYIVDALDDAALKRILPEGLDAVVLDLGGSIEATILATNSLKKLGVGEIIVHADSEERGEILTLVGATRVVYPDKEAAARIVPLLVSPSLFSFMPIGENFVIAEVRVPERYAGMNLVEASLRQRHGINVVAIRLEGSSEYRYFSADYRLSAVDLLLVAGSEKDVISFSGGMEQLGHARRGEIFKGLLKGKGRKG
jgi:trk system potassium uptake protein TrkA